MSKKRMHNALYVVIAAIISVMFVLPVFWVVLSSFKTPNEIFSVPPVMIPKKFLLDNYIEALERADFVLYFKNSAIVAIATTTLAVMINTMAGYAFAKYRFKGANLIFMIFLSTSMLPLEVLMIPIFQVVKKLGLYNTMAGLIIPAAATPTGVFLVRQYFLSVPSELMEAARIDGASEMKILARVMIPLAKPILSVLAILNFMWSWNSYLWPLIVVRSKDLYTVQVAIRNFSGENSVNWGGILSMSVVTMIPMLIIFLIFQKQFVRGMATTGLKG